MRDSKGRFLKGSKGGFQKGHPSYWTDKLRKEQSVRAKERGFGKWSLGRKLTEEHKQKCRDNSARHWLGKRRPDVTGKNNCNWKEDKVAPTLIRSIRQSYHYKRWRLGILNKDGYKCVECGSTELLEVDHPKKFIYLIEENGIKNHEQALACEILWTDTGRTLCRICHHKTPNYGNRDKKKIQA